MDFYLLLPAQSVLFLKYRKISYLEHIGFLFPTFKTKIFTPETNKEMKDKLLGNIIHIIF